MKDFIGDSSTWKIKNLAGELADQDLADAAATSRDLNLVYALARACSHKDAADRKECVYTVLSNALVNAASTNDTRTVDNVWYIWDMLRQHNWPRLYVDCDNLLELCVHESSADESSAEMLNRFVRNWLDWQHAKLFGEHQAMAEAKELLCAQIKTGDIDKVLAACMRLVLVTSDAVEDVESLGYDALDCMFWVQELAKALIEHYQIIMCIK